MEKQANIFYHAYTSFRCASVARYLLKVADIQELKKALAFCSIHKIPYLILGKGSNSIFSDEGFYGLLARKSSCFLELFLKASPNSNPFAAVKGRCPN